MSRTITAMFDSRNEAEAAKERLNDSNIDADRVRIVDQNSSGSTSSAYGDSSSTTDDSAMESSRSSASTSGQQEGFWASLKDMFMPDEDRQTYGEHIRRGGFMLVAEVDENEADRACSILEESDSVDYDERQNEWRSQGWAGNPTGGQSGAFGQLSGNDSEALGRDRDTDEERIPIVEEELRVGKREVERGGARVRSYVRETPVHEQVNLREEHVEIERRPVDRAVDANDGDAFRDREIEMTERSEEAVIGKEAHVREELVVRKTSDERVENIDDTVRRTEVDVDQTGGKDRSAFSGLDGDRDQSTKRSDYERTETDRKRDDGLL